VFVPGPYPWGRSFCLTFVDADRGGGWTEDSWRPLPKRLGETAGQPYSLQLLMASNILLELLGDPVIELRRLGLAAARRT